MTNFVTYVHTGFPYEHEIRRHIGQLELMCHSGIRKESEAEVWDFKGKVGNS